MTNPGLTEAQVAVLAQWDGLAVHIARRVTGPRAGTDVEDVVQEIRRVLVRKIATYDPDKGTFPNWAWTVGWRAARQFVGAQSRRGINVPVELRPAFAGVRFCSICNVERGLPGGERRGRVTAEALPDHRPDGTAEVERAESWDRLTAGLTDREREVLWLRFVEDLTMEEIGSRMNLCGSYTSQVYHGAIRKLRGRVIREAS